MKTEETPVSHQWFNNGAIVQVFGTAEYLVPTTGQVIRVTGIVRAVGGGPGVSLPFVNLVTEHAVDGYSSVRATRYWPLRAGAQSNVDAVFLRVVSVHD